MFILVVKKFSLMNRYVLSSKNFDLNDKDLWMLGFHSIERGTFSSGFRSKKGVTKKAAPVKPNPKPNPKPTNPGQPFMFMNRLFNQPAQPGVRTILPPPPGRAGTKPPTRTVKSVPPSVPEPSFPPPVSKTIVTPWKQAPASAALNSGDVVRLQKDQNSIIEILNALWEMCQSSSAPTFSSVPADHNETRLSRIERDVSDLRQQQNLLVRDKQEDGAELSNILAELSSLKQRLSKALSQAADQLARMEKASVPAQIQKVVDQLQVDSNWLYATVMTDKLPYYASASFVTQPVGVYSNRQRILILYKTVENKDGIWMQVRNAQEPEKRYWIRLTDEKGNVTVGHFGIAA